MKKELDQEYEVQVDLNRSYERAQPKPKYPAVFRLDPPLVFPHYDHREQQFTPWYLTHLARAYTELGQFDDALRCVDEAMTAMETTRERCEAEAIERPGKSA